MSFYGTSFIFDGTACEEFGLMMYDFESNTQEAGTIGSEVKIQEDRLWGRYTPLDYGSNENDPLEFNLIFGVNSGDHRLDRFDVAKIAGWLKQPGYHYLHICQSDMEDFHYKCRITELVPIFISNEIIGMKAKVVCDSPYAYWMPERFSFQCIGTKEIIIHNKSNINRYYYPLMTITTSESGGTIHIINNDSGDNFKLSSLPAKSISIEIDGENGILISSDGINVYEYSNFAFPRLLRGDNHISLIGNFSLDMIVEFPFDIGC